MRWCQERLFGWQATLFPTGSSGLSKIKVGGLRDDARGVWPHGAAAGAFQAAPADRLETETRRFLG